MTDRPVKLPGPDHPIDLTAAGGRVTATVGDRVIASTDAALMLAEAGYPPVAYIPLADVDHDLLEPSTKQSYCPYKGEASYWSLRVDDRLIEDAVWSYDDPHPAMREIAGHVAFYPDKVQVTVGN